MKKGSSSPNVKGSKTTPKKLRVVTTVKAPIHGKVAKMYHASRGKTSLGFTTPRRGSQH